jgi:hypothetical protein
MLCHFHPHILSRTLRSSNRLIPMKTFVLIVERLREIFHAWKKVATLLS